jgi:hypothetical protein
MLQVGFSHWMARLTHTENTLIRIGYNNQSGLSLGPATEYDFACQIMKAI